MPDEHRFTSEDGGDENAGHVFRPPQDWEAVYADSPELFFGEEPSQIARSALRWFRAYGVSPARGLALDLGSGEGRDTVYLAAAGLRVTARDLAPTGVAKTRALMGKQGVPADRVDVAVGDVRDFSFPPRAYDIALATNVFQFLVPDDVPDYITRLQGTAKPGGIVGVGVFSPAMLAWGADLTGHVTATPDELAARFPVTEGWLLLERAEYWIYRPPEQVMASFTYVVARKGGGDTE